MVTVTKQGELYFVLLNGEAILYADLPSLVELVQVLSQFVPGDPADLSPLEVI